MNRIRIAGKHYNEIRKHLFCGDGNEAVVIALCGRASQRDNNTLTVQEVHTIPYETCYERTPVSVHWSTEQIIPLIEKAKKRNLAILKIHSHPKWYEDFSETDDESDKNLFNSIDAWFDNDAPHASCIMLPNGRIFGRMISSDFQLERMNQIFIAGSDIYSWHYSKIDGLNKDLQVRNKQAFGEKTIQILNGMKIGIVGCSGTGSIVIEQLKKLGVGELVLVDPDFVDKINLNRILNATYEDAQNKRPKVSVMKHAIELSGFGTTVKTFTSHVSAYNVVKELSDCDILFSCVDGAEGRHILNLISSFYCIPMYDLGVRLEADGEGGINGIYGSVHYIQPGGSSLLSRGQYSLEKLKAEGMKRTNLESYEQLVENKYLVNVNESNPAVISINMQVASNAVNDFLARIHPYRNISNDNVEIIRILFSECTTFYEKGGESCAFFNAQVGKGDIKPLLNNPELSYVPKVAEYI